MEATFVAPPEPAVSAAPGLSAVEPFFAELEKRLDALLESRLDALDARRRETERQTLMDRFVAEHPDFRTLAADGSLEAQQRANGLLDDVGAYFAHHLQAERQEHAAALETARQEAAAAAEVRAMERFRAKGLARTLSVAPADAGRGRGVDPDLAAPEKFGGVNAVLAARLSARRQSAGV